MTMRAALLRWHRRIGVTVAVLLLLSACTGAVLLFRGELVPARPRAEPIEERVSLDAIVAAGVAAGDGAPATDLGLPEAPTDPYVVWLDDDAETEIYLDGRAQVIGRRAGAAGVTRLLFELHTGELLGPVGTALSLFAAIGLVVLACSGVYSVLARMRRRAKTVTTLDSGDRRAA
jgi:uncharacterized iron-regulated membrane protein